MNFRNDLMLHALVCFIAQLIAYKIPYSFFIIVVLAVAKEYGLFEFVYKWFNIPHTETKDLDDVIAGIAGAAVGLATSYFIWRMF